MNTPIVTEVGEGYKLQCPDCSFKVQTLTANYPAVHICSGKNTVKWNSAPIKGERTHRKPVVVKKKDARR